MEEGKGYTGVQVNWGQAVKTIQDGSADAFVLPQSHPGRITAALASGDMTIFSLPKDVYESEAFAKIGDLPGTVPTTLKISEMGYGDGIAVVSEDDIFRGPGTVGGEVVNVDMDFELAKALLKPLLTDLMMSI